MPVPRSAIVYGGGFQTSGFSSFKQQNLPFTWYMIQAQSLFTEVSCPGKTRANLAPISKCWRLADLDICISVSNILIIYYCHKGRWKVDAVLFCLGRALDFIGQGRVVIGDSGKPIYSKAVCWDDERDQDWASLSTYFQWDWSSQMFLAECCLCSSWVERLPCAGCCADGHVLVGSFSAHSGPRK